ncbi:MAG TPA: CBS domain-containing protein [Actinomycetota bacterium]|jgi:CBS domain-containing protein|nr:CBS domain-containing protein [Actinomycetota bacterium]
MATAADIMTPKVVTTREDTSIWDAARVLLDRRYGGMPVVDSSGKVIGMVSGFDVISKRGRTVGEIMSRGVVSVKPGDSLDAVIQLMGLHGIRRVPVREGELLVGIISRSDLLAHFVDEYEHGDK